MSAEVRRAAVLGHPIAHSLSPVIHRRAYELLQLAWTYDKVDLTPDQLPQWLDARDSEWIGVSLTMPLKTDVLPLLDRLDPVVRSTGAANTVIFEPGMRCGYNTDVEGIVMAVREAVTESERAQNLACGFDRALVVGAGATARSALVAAADLGCRSVDVLARRPEACSDLLTTGAAVGVEPEILPWRDEFELDYDLVISTVPAGVADDLVARVPEWPGVLLDVVYQSWPTPFAQAWTDRGGHAASGLEMLLHQGVRQISLMTGLDVDPGLIRPTLLAAAGLDG